MGCFECTGPRSFVLMMPMRFSGTGLSLADRIWILARSFSMAITFPMMVDPFCGMILWLGRSTEK